MDLLCPSHLLLLAPHFFPDLILELPVLPHAVHVLLAPPLLAMDILRQSTTSELSPRRDSVRVIRTMGSFGRGARGGMAGVAAAAMSALKEAHCHCCLWSITP